jgi:hypothetical protein
LHEVGEILETCGIFAEGMDNQDRILGAVALRLQQDGGGAVEKLIAKCIRLLGV